ncbi:hypothetical protein DESC_590145 [Desulfosarcina cetonica]|nr:hypothetical protein DESC_590145 [Desulfosarcina cetonica]
MNLGGQALDVFGRVDAAPARFDDHDQLVHGLGRGPTEMLDAGLHVHDHHLVASQDHVGDQGLEQGGLRAEATATPFLDAAQAHELDVAQAGGEGVGNIVDLGIEFEESADGAGLGAGAFEDQLLHFGDGGDLVGIGDAQGRRQVGVRVGIDGQHGLAAIAQGPGQKGRKCCLAYAAFSADCQFHTLILSCP